MTATAAAHPAWLPTAAFAPLGRRAIAVVQGDAQTETVAAEAAAATTAHGGSAVRFTGEAPRADIVFALEGGLGDEAFRVRRADGSVTVAASSGRGLLYGFFHLVRLGEAAFEGSGEETHEPSRAIRILNHWDNMDLHPVMGAVERGYAGASIFFSVGDGLPGSGHVRDDLSRVGAYARLLASIGINAVSVNNVNVHHREARLLTDDLEHAARIAAALRPYGVRLHLAVSWAAPVMLGGLATSDPFDADVKAWWAEAADRVWAAIPDFGGFVVKADSEGQPGPFAYGRDHADGANMLAEAVAPHGGIIHWRAFVYNHTQDWRDRSTDRARAAFDHFAPLDGRFRDNVIVQVKFGPMDFQVREPISPVLAAMPNTRVALELQVTQEYTGQQKHAVYLGPQWTEVMRFDFGGDSGQTVAALAQGGFAAVANVGDDEFWTGHPFAQANLYAYGRLTWNPDASATDLLDEWIGQTFAGEDATTAAAIHDILADSWRTYEKYTTPLGVGFMVRPGHHYGPDVDGYEYTPWGTYHFADRDGIGVDRTVATGTGFAGLYPSPWRETYESLETVPDELILFFHHVPYAHVLHSGTTVIQHIYDTHFEGVERVQRDIEAWNAVSGSLRDRDLVAGVDERFAEQLRSAIEWRDQVNTYFLRKSGVADARGRRIY
ncbi:alpha-glucuronidase [Microbacterium stercoris]|uniref:Alpha-glucuronidase n=1 Tax=Microbacterium stercoris TaxID=2820289 RepID=A0A939QJ60_9MICO|nr:alpha-glucuronidase [Microbacterium stercoris]MBO3662652.1 alpha-glucuronidase [Microbacterium stercoris]